MKGKKIRTRDTKLNDRACGTELLLSLFRDSFNYFYRTIWKDSTQLLVSAMYYCKPIPQCRCSTKCSASLPPVVFRE